MEVGAKDQFGNLEPGFQGSVTISQPGNVTGTTTVTAKNGVATFSNLAIDTVGTYTLEATSGTLHTRRLDFHHDHRLHSGEAGLDDPAAGHHHRGYRLLGRAGRPGPVWQRRADLRPERHRRAGLERHFRPQ